jgi:dinuclear metal center YbgI/SA1388 family protein
MSIKLSELIPVFDSLWPQSGADEWDQVGLVSGSADQEIAKVLLCVDPTLNVLREAKLQSCQLVLSHHPLLLEGVHSVAEGELKGDIVSYAISNSIALFAAHTNADIVPGGVSDILAKQIGLADLRPLVATSKDSGHGRVGVLTDSLKLKDLAVKINNLLPATHAPVRIAGDTDRTISKVAVVGGSGASFLPDAIAAGADCFVTSDLKHHVSLDAISDLSSEICLIDISHFAAESIWLQPAAEELRKLAPGIEFVVSELITDPWSMSLPGKLA